MELAKLNEIEQQMSDDLQWGLTAPEVQQHPGQLVAVYIRRVVGVGTERMALVRQAAQEEQCHWGDIAVIAVPSQEAWETPR
jgi:phosphatidate phosphatase APP1